MNKQLVKPEKPARLQIIACGALARELSVLIDQLPNGAVALTCLPASWHNHPEKIVPSVKKKIAAARRAGTHIAVAYGDCGTGGALDHRLGAENIPRIAGLHCHEKCLCKPEFDAEMETALGKFLLTD